MSSKKPTQTTPKAQVVSSTQPAPVPPSDDCHRCGQEATSSSLRIGNYRFHKQHFSCYVCDENLHGEKFYHKLGEFYCAADYVDKFCHTCQHCQRKIKGGSVIEAFGGYYHPQHFVCVICEQPFKEEKYYDIDNRPYCHQHFVQATEKRCFQCHEKVVEEDDTVKVNNKVFHSTCLHCAQCSQSLAREESIFQKANKVYCRKDYLNLFSHRCTHCGHFILKHCITVNNEFYHSDCLKCSICQVKLRSYICVRGHLRCNEHVNVETPTLPCHVCENDIVGGVGLQQACGLNTHKECFKCTMCQTPLTKEGAKRNKGKIVCDRCVRELRASSSRNRSRRANRPSNSDSASPRRSSSDNLRRSSSDEPSAPDSTSSATKRLKTNTRRDSNERRASQQEGRQSREGKRHRRNPSFQRESNSVSHLSQQPTDRPPIEWRKGELIGKGSFGKVYMGMNGVTGELLAVKRIKLSSEEDHVQAAQIETETSLLKDLNHENIVKLIATQRHNHYLDIIMEYIPGKSLDVLLEKFGVFSEKIIKNYTKQLLSALAYCHEKNVVHRDIKGKNILLDAKGNMKLADFGSAKRFNAIVSKDAPSMNYNYTPLWTAPEVLMGEYNHKVDVWGVGCVVIEMATGKAPWSEEKFDNPFRALYHIGNTDAIPRFPEGFSEAGNSFLTACLTRDPNVRPTVSQLLHHKWLVDAAAPPSSRSNTTVDDDSSDSD